MLTCKQFEALISDYLDGLVSRETQAHIDAHLLENEHSRTLLQNVVTTRETLQCLPSICASADFDLRLRSRMAEVARTSGNRPFAWPSFFVGNSRMVMGFAAAACLTIGAFTFNQFGETTEYFPPAPAVSNTIPDARQSPTPLLQQRTPQHMPQFAPSPTNTPPIYLAAGADTNRTQDRPDPGIQQRENFKQNVQYINKTR